MVERIFGMSNLELGVPGHGGVLFMGGRSSRRMADGVLVGEMELIFRRIIDSQMGAKQSLLMVAGSTRFKN